MPEHLSYIDGNSPLCPLPWQRGFHRTTPYVPAPTSTVTDTVVIGDTGNGNIVESKYYTLPTDYLEIERRATGVAIVGLNADCFSHGQCCVGGNFILPERINGQPVTEIGAGVFEQLPITGVQFPPHIRHIHDRAFYGCDKLKEVHFSGQDPIRCGDEVFAGTLLSGKIPSPKFIISDGSAPFPEGCTFQKIVSGPSGGLQRVFETPRGAVAKIPKTDDI